MKSFFEHLKSQIGSFSKNDLLIFPTKRSGVHFKQYLSLSANGVPAFAPITGTFTDLATILTNGRRLANELYLIFELYKILVEVKKEKYKGKDAEPESFARFFFWGNMLLRDFTDIANSLADGKKIFGTLKDHKIIDRDFDPLQSYPFDLDEEEQAEIGESLRKFIEHFINRRKSTKSDDGSFVEIWDILPEVYNRFELFIDSLETGEVYEGKLYQLAALLPTDAYQNVKYDRVIFAGLDYLTPAQIRIIQHLVSAGKGIVVFDAESYIVDNQVREAGYHLRRYRTLEGIKQNFTQSVQNSLQVGVKKRIHVYPASLLVEQCKIAGHILSQIPDDQLKDTLLLLPTADFIFPMLGSLPSNIKYANLSIGFPFKATPIYGLIRIVIEMWNTAKGTADAPLFYQKSILRILRHPYILSRPNKLIHWVENSSRPFISLSGLNRVVDDAEMQVPMATQAILRTIFTLPEGVDNYLTTLKLIIRTIQGLYLKNISEAQGASADDEVAKTNVEYEYFVYLYKLLMQIEEMRNKYEVELSAEELNGFLMQLVKTVQIPFVDRRFEGIQILGLPETASLDFKHIVALGINEDTLPTAPPAGSFIVANLRKGFGLPLADDHQAHQAYLFYRLIIKAEAVHLIYNTHTDNNYKGEPSRFLMQLQYDGGLLDDTGKIFEIVQHIKPATTAYFEPRPISFKKEGIVWERLIERFTTLSPTAQGFDTSGLSASSLYNYIQCPLRFALRDVLQMYPPQESSEELGADVMGNIFHLTMQNLHSPYLGKKITSEILKEMANDLGRIIRAFENAYITHYKLEVLPTIEGKELMMREVIFKYVQKVLEYDGEKIKSFELWGLEAKYKKVHPIRKNEAGETVFAVFSGKIDRVDKVEDSIRVLDYKTGADELTFKTIEELFDDQTDSKRKVVFQTLLYAWLFTHNHQFMANEMVTPAVYPIRKLSDTFESNLVHHVGRGQYNPLTDAADVMSDFENNLINLTQEIFNPDLPFNQTTNVNNCKYCDYKAICQRD